MKLRGPDNVVVYYVTAAVSALIILAYIAAGDVTPIVGFLMGGVLMFAMYPNKTIALVMGILISAALRKPNREGFKEGETGETPTEQPVENPVDVLAKAAEAAKKVGKEGNVGAPAAPAGAAATTTAAPAGAAATTTAAPVATEDTNGRPQVTPPHKDTPATTSTTTVSPFVGNKKLSPAALSSGGASSPQDVEKLSQMIDKTMELLKMLPDGFLQNAVK